jgi:hypothetical protein
MNESLITPEELRKLAEAAHPVSVSLFTPTDPKNVDWQSNRISFKNQVAKVMSWLKELKLERSTWSSLAQSSDNLLKDERFWQNQTQGLAMYVAEETVKIYQLHVSSPELSMVNDHFYIRPLISELEQQFTFYILELDKEHTQMWQGTEDGVAKIVVPDLPLSVEEVTGVEGNERQLQFHTDTAAPSGGARPAIYHGSSNWQDDHDQYLAHFLQAVDKAVVEFFKQREGVLVLGGIEKLQIMFRELTHFRDLLESGIPRIPDPAHKEKTLHELGWAAVSEFRGSRRDKLVQNFVELDPAKKLTTIPEVLRHAAQGQVDTLLIAEEAQTWGIFDKESLATVLENTQTPLSAELINMSARLVLTTSGSVIPLPQSHMPDKAMVAATLRY